MCKMLICTLDNIEIGPYIFWFFFLTRLINPIAIWPFLLIDAWVITRLKLPTAQVFIRRIASWLLAYGNYRLTYQDLSYLLTLFFHHFLENFDFFMKRLLFCLESRYLFPVELIPAQYLIEELFRFLLSISIHVFDKLSPWKIHCTVKLDSHLSGKFLLLLLDSLLFSDLFSNMTWCFLWYRALFRFVEWFFLFFFNNHNCSGRFWGIYLLEPFILSILKTFDQFTQLIQLWLKLVLWVIHYQLLYCLNRHFLFRIYELDQFPFHDLILFHEITIIELFFLKKRLHYLQYSSPYSSHQFANLILWRITVLILLNKLLLFFIHAFHNVHNFWMLQLMLNNWVLYKELMILIPLLGDDVFIVLKELDVALLSFFEVTEKDCPVVVEVGLQTGSILEVHSNKYIISEEGPKYKFVNHSKLIILLIVSWITFSFRQFK